ncbi:thiolase family protein [Syntrophomonas wolfei]|uniref:acetyl-CoA C-acetyltransferase n=1 Tax=Syntrophomonas wolfei subsp. wolfei (strain DSM 2245B / Goettingen) TaxID=335541 RepID=Q0AZ52_SYNWW|nr:thiolase family protein [Syntrophomonas wolfei]ABI68002.1 Acetyl-CoA C-acetyltransferase [Syntrophomonas wolfei subsp. wolfei str. Goettingen G311]
MAEINEVVVVGMARTPIGRYLGGLASVRANDLAIIAANAAIERAGVDPGIIDEIVGATCLHAGNGSLPPRIIGMKVGLPVRSGSCMVSQNCASGMRATEIACQNIMLGKTDISLVTAVESMSNIPYLLQQARSGYRMGDGKVQDAMLSDGLVCQLAGGHMGMTAENIAEKYGITREECDALALTSHQNAVKAVDEGIFDREIVPVVIKSKKGDKVISKDEHPIRGASLETMAKLPPAFKKGGVVTAANASGINDCAAAAVFMSKKKCEELGLKPLMKLVGICSEGVDAKVMGLGPAVAMPKVLKQAGWKYEDVDYWEVNEAFAAQVLGVVRMLKEEAGIELDFSKTNHNGSGIGLGHPVGATGLRIIVSMYYELERLGLTKGGASLCVGGGSAMASLWTRDI